MTTSKKSSRTRTPLLLLLGAFVVPVVAAQLVLSMNWYQGGATNSGQLIPGSPSYHSFNMQNPQPEHWQLLYQLPAKCDVDCQQHLYIMQQSYQALAKDKHRLHPIILLTQYSDTSALSQFTFKTYTASTSLQQFMLPQQIVVVDPLGQLVMQYQFQGDQKTQIMQGKAMVKDMRKMLKLSRVG